MPVTFDRISLPSIYSGRLPRGGASPIAGSCALALLLLAACGEKGDAGDRNTADTMMISSAGPKVDSVPAVTPPGLPPSLPNHLRVGNAIKGIGVTREQVDKGMGEIYTFMPFDSLEGHASVIAEYGDIHSMLIGPAEDLLLASIFAPLINDKESNDASNAAIEGFVRSVTPEAMQWIRASIGTALSTHAKTEQTQTFGNHKVVFAHDLYEGHADAGHVTITITHI